MLTSYLTFCIFVSTLGMFNFGYNTAVVSAPAGYIRNFTSKVISDRHGTPLAARYVTLIFSGGVSIFAIGGMIGGVMGGHVANKFGRKHAMFLNNFLAIIGGVSMYLMPIVKSYELFYIGRIIVGLHCGFSSCLCPMYVSEIAPLRIRGAVGTINQLAVTLGLLVSEVLGLDFILGGERVWHYLLGMTIVPAIIQLVLLWFCVESPVFLLSNKHRETIATNALVRLRSRRDVTAEIAMMQSESNVARRVKIRELFMTPTLQAPTVIAIAMHCSQQLTGIVGVFYYSVSLFEQAGAGSDAGKYMNIGIGGIMVVMTIVIIPLMDTVGRKKLHLAGLGGMLVSSVIITISMANSHLTVAGTYISICFILLFVVFFAVGPGAIPWLITAELFTEGPRPAAIALATMVNWFANFLVGLSFEFMAMVLKAYIFVPYTLLLMTFFVFTLLYVPETKNKTCEEIANYFEELD